MKETTAAAVAIYARTKMTSKAYSSLGIGVARRTTYSLTKAANPGALGG